MFLSHLAKIQYSQQPRPKQRWPKGVTAVNWLHTNPSQNQAARIILCRIQAKAWCSCRSSTPAIRATELVYFSAYLGCSLDQVVHQLQACVLAPIGVPKPCYLDLREPLLWRPGWADLQHLGHVNTIRMVVVFLKDTGMPAWLYVNSRFLGSPVNF